MDPTTLLQHPIPVRNIIMQIPPSLLNSLLTHHAQAFQPVKPIVTSLTPDAITVSYQQPFREVWANPAPRTAKINFTPPLPALPRSSAPEPEQYAWESACALRLREMEAESTRINEGRSDIIVSRYLPPNKLYGWLGILQFVGLTLLIIVQLRFQPAVLQVLFEPEWKFNGTVILHAGILVKKSRDIMNMNDKLRKHQVDKAAGGKWRGPWIMWMITTGFEGWRCAERFDNEVARVGRGLATAVGSKKER